MKIKEAVCICLMSTMIFAGCGEKTVEAGNVSDTGSVLKEESASELEGNGQAKDLKAEEKITVVNEYGDLIDVRISKDRAIEIAKQKQKEYFGVELADNIEVNVSLEGGYSVLEPNWNVTMLKKDDFYGACMIDVNTGAVTFGSYMYFNEKPLTGNEISLEEAKKIILKFLVDKKIIKSENEVRYVGQSKEFQSKKGWSLDFASVSDENHIYNVAVDKVSKKVNLYLDYKKLTPKEREQLKEYGESHMR